MNAIEPPRVVLDTNLLVSGLASRKGAPYFLLQGLFARRFRIVVSTMLLTEYRDVLSRPGFRVRHGIRDEEVRGFFDVVDADGDIAPPLLTIPITVRDPKDEKVLAIALGGGADYLVTGDQDLLVLADDPRLGTLKIVTPRAFLNLLQEP